MNDTNPYQTLGVPKQTEPAKPESPSKAKWAFIGGIMGFALPAGFGANMIHQHQAYVASLPSNQGICGMDVLAALMMMFVLGPISGIIGAILGWVAANLCRKSTDQTSSTSLKAKSTSSLF